MCLRFLNGHVESINKNNPDVHSFIALIATVKRCSDTGLSFFLVCKCSPNHVLISISISSNHCVHAFVSDYIWTVKTFEDVHAKWSLFG